MPGAVVSANVATLFLAAVFPAMAQYGEIPVISHEAHPPVNYVTPPGTSYGEPAGKVYAVPGSYYGGGGGGKAAGRVKIQVFRGPTVESEHGHYAPWGYYVVQPSDVQKEHSHDFH